MHCRYTDPQSWRGLACSLAILTKSDLYSGTGSSLTLAEQLLYLAQGEQAFTDFYQPQDLQPPPAFNAANHHLSPSLWESLQKIPLSVNYYTAVMKSLHEDPQFWESVSGKGVSTISQFPWKREAEATGQRS